MRIERVAQRVFRNWPAKVLSLGAAVLLLVFHDITRLEERFISIPMVLVVNDTLVPASPYPRQARVRLRGETDHVFGVLEEEITAVADLSAADREGEYRVPVRIAWSGTDTRESNLEASVEPDSITVTLEIKLLKSVEVAPSLSGFPPSGYELTQARMTPSAVEIEGPRSRVEGVTQVRTEDVDLSTKREDFTERLRLVPPDDLVAFPGGDIVEMRGIIDEAVVLSTFEEVDVLVTGLDPAFRLVQSLPNGEIRVQGKQLELESVAPTDVQLLINASSILEPGTVRLPVQPVVPPGIAILRFEPTSMVLIVERAE